jgi:HAE1 family hydrophobic/amphiphilic exporter-1
VDVTLVMPASTDIATTDAVVQQLESRLRTYPEVSQVTSHTGSSSAAAALASGAGGGGATSQLTVRLVPADERRRSAADLANIFRQQLGASIPGATLRTALPNPFGFGGFGGQAIQVAVEGPDPATLDRLVSQVTQAVAEVPGVVDVNNSNLAIATEYAINVDLSRSADLGVSAQTAGVALAAAVSGIKVSKFEQPGQSNVDIRLIANETFRASTSNLASLPLLTSSGTLVRLDQIGSITRSTAPTQIAHDNRQRSVTVNASAASGYSVGTLQLAIQQRLAGIGLPSGYSIVYGGQAAMGGQTFGDIFKALGAGLVLMYVLMALLFRSLTLPLAVLMSLPLAVVGALGAMGLTGTNFTLFSLLGVSLLMGLVGKNAILLVDYTDTLRKRGDSRLEALLEAGPTRLRPIFMTTLSVMFALVPVASGIEAGSELLKAAAVVLIGGLLTSTLLTLVFVPAMYTIFDDIEHAVRRLFVRSAEARQADRGPAVPTGGPSAAVSR